MVKIGEYLVQEMEQTVISQFHHQVTMLLNPSRFIYDTSYSQYDYE